MDPKIPIKKASQGQAGAIGGGGRRRGGEGKTGRKEGKRERGKKTTYSHAVEREVEVTHSFTAAPFDGELG